MGRWLASLRAEEKNTKIALRRTDKTDETFPDRILSVLSVPSPGIPEKFSAIDSSPESDEAWIEERKALATNSVPEPYLDAWARLQVQKPMRVSDAEWRQAIDAAGRFLDQWGSRAVEFGWTAGDLFDVPRDGKPGGLVWFLGGESVQANGPRRMVTQDGRVFNRFEN
jgi:hypothetical protein